MPTPTTMNDSHRQEQRHASLHDVREDAAALKADAADCAAGMAETGVEAIKTGAEAVCDTAKSAASSAREAHEKLNETISSRPTTSVLIAFGIGALAARLLARR